MARREATERRGAEEQRDSGMPGGGQGRTDEVGGSGVYPMSGPHPEEGDAEVEGMASWGQGERGAEGREDSGGSEFSTIGDEKMIGGMTSGPGGTPEREHGAEDDDVEDR